MPIFGGVGFGEIIFVLVLMVIVLGPKKMVEGARSLGKTIRKVTRSEFWKEAVKASREIQSIPKKIIDEAGIEDDVKEISRALNPKFPNTINGNAHPAGFDLENEQGQKPQEPPRPKG